MSSILRQRLSSTPVVPRSGRDVVNALTVSSGAVLIAMSLGIALVEGLQVSNVSLVFLPAIAFSAARYGTWVAAWSVVLSMAGTAYFVGPPSYPFPFEHPAPVWAFAAFVVTAAVSSTIAVRLRQQTVAIRRQNTFAKDMYTFTSRLAAASGVDDVARALVLEVRAVLDRESILYLARDGALAPCAVDADTADLDSTEVDALHAYWNAGRPTPLHTAVPGEHAFVPVAAGVAPIGVLFVRPRSSARSERTSSEDELRLLGTLTNQAAMTLERVRLAEQIQDARVEAEADRLRAALLSAVSHDLKTPLASILGNISSVREYAHLYDDATRDEMLASAQTEAERLSRFVSNLLHMTRIDAGAVRPAFEMVDLSDVVGSAIKSAGRLLDRHWVRVDLEDDLPMVRLDCVLIDHVLVNLLDNAAKYAPGGSLIRISAREIDANVRLQVEDEGPGIRSEDLPRVFDRFFRAGGDRQPAGTGLGLAICRCFLEAMGARIAASNRADRSGAVFAIDIPAPHETTRVVNACP